MMHFLLIVCTTLALTEAGGLALVKFNGFTGSCAFNDIGYKPGGPKVTIQRVTAPVAILQKNIMSKVAGKGAMSANLLMHSTNAAKAFGVFAKAGTDFVEKFAEIAPKLASSLGVLGASLGFVADATKPSAQQIIDSTNKALSQFAEEVNLRLDEMKGYVDEKTIQIEKTSFKSEFQKMQNLWLFCINERSKDDVIDCQKDAAKYITSTVQFLMFNDERNAGVDLDPYNVKRLEVSLLMFRDYSTLDINVLESLGGSHELYKDESSYHMDSFKFYIKKMAADIKMFKAYAIWAVAQIKRVHLTNNCDSTFKCEAKEIYEGFFNTHTATNILCDCNFDKTLVGSIRCKQSLFYRRDGKLLQSPWYTIWKGSNPLTYESMRILNTKSSGYRKAVGDYIDTYWQNEILDLVDTWDEVIDRAEKRIKGEDVKRSVPEDNAEDNAEKFRVITEPYSDKFNERFEKVMKYIKS